MTTVELRRSDFRHAVSLASKAITRHDRIPILSMVRCRANGAFEAAATDLDMQIEAKVPRGGTGNAEFMLNDPRAIIGATGEPEGEGLTITFDDKSAAFAVGATALTQQRFAAPEDYPALQPIASDTFTATLGADFIAAISRVAGAMSEEGTRYYLNGIFMHKLDGWNYRFAATDGHRLFCMDVPLPDAVGDLGDGIIIPRRAIKLLMATAGKSQDGIAFTVGHVGEPNEIKDTAPARSGLPRIEYRYDSGAARVALASKLIDGTFPDYRRVIPNEEGAPLVFKTAELRRAVKAASYGTEKVRVIKLTLTDKGAEIAAKYIDSGIATKTELACEHRRSGVEVGLNGQYVLDALDAARGDEIALFVVDAAAPILMKNPADPAWTGVQMPIRV